MSGPSFFSGMLKQAKHTSVCRNFLMLGDATFMHACMSCLFYYIPKKNNGLLLVQLLSLLHHILFGKPFNNQQLFTVFFLASQWRWKCRKWCCISESQTKTRSSQTSPNRFQCCITAVSWQIKCKISDQDLGRGWLAVQSKKLQFGKIWQIHQAQVIIPWTDEVASRSCRLVYQVSIFFLRVS